MPRRKTRPVRNGKSKWFILGLVLIVAGSIGVFSEPPMHGGDAATFLVGIIAIVTGVFAVWTFRGHA